MNDLETQVARIQLGNLKQTNSYVSILAEKASNDDAELYVIIELPLFNPAAMADCETIANAIVASLQRSYRKQLSDTTFENALAEINEELGKLATMGQTHWIGKLNALIGVKTSSDFYIATTGKITALLFREGQFSAIADASPANHPLKTFENFAVGKIRLDDVLILSTTQLFNYISVDRVKNILTSYSLPLAAEQVISVLQENAGPEIAFGTLIMLMVEPGSILEEEAETFLGTEAVAGTPIGQRVQEGMVNAWNVAKHETARWYETARKKITNRQPKQNSVVNISPTNKLKEFGNQAKDRLALGNFKGFSRQKKFFFISLVVLLLALIANIFITSHYKKARVVQADYSAKIESIQKLIADANASYLYRDDQKVQSLMQQAQEGIAGISNPSDTQKQEVDKLKSDLATLQNKIEKKTVANASTIATLSPTEHLIKLPNYLATQTAGAIVSYDRTTGKTQDNVLKSTEAILGEAAIKNSEVVIYNGSQLLYWDLQSGNTSKNFSDHVPSKNAFGGMQYYTTNTRVYMVDTGSSKIISFLVGDKGITKPTVSVQNQGDLTGASDITINSGNIYVYNNGTIDKFFTGKSVDFTTPSLVTAFGSKGKLFSTPDSSNLFVLDPSNKRIVVINLKKTADKKEGDLVQIITSPQFNSPKDFTVDEKTKTIFVLDDTNLLKLGY